MAYYSNKACKNCGKEDNDWRHARCSKCLEPLPGTDKPLKLSVEEEKKKKKKTWSLETVLPIISGAFILLAQTGLLEGVATPDQGAKKDSKTQLVAVQKKPQPAKPAPKANSPIAPKPPLPSRDVFSPTRVHGDVYVHDHFDGRLHAHGPFDPPHKDTRQPVPSPRVASPPSRSTTFYPRRVEPRRVAPTPSREAPPLDQLLRQASSRLR